MKSTRGAHDEGRTFPEIATALLFAKPIEKGINAGENGRHVGFDSAVACIVMEARGAFGSQISAIDRTGFREDEAISSRKGA